jgi:iron complex transport system ATP-binding protein
MTSPDRDSSRAPTVLEIIDATVLKGGVRALNGLTLTIHQGQHTAIVGPNGAGKSTLINLLTRDEYALPRADGRAPVRIFGRARWNVFELRTRLGIVSADLQQRFVEGHSAGRITGMDAVLSGFFATRGFLLYADITPGMRERAARALERIEAAHLSGKVVNEMSTGEARRIMIARALATEPAALVLDEPAAGLDPVARRRFLDVIGRIGAEGTTLVLVTHHVEEILPIITQVALLKDGRVAFAGSKASVLTSENLSAVFDAPVALEHSGDRFFLRDW